MEEIGKWDRKEEEGLSEEVRRNRDTLKDQLSIVLEMEEVKWRQLSRVKWLKKVIVV